MLISDVTDNLNKIVNNYWNRVELDGNPESDLIHATGCKHPSLRYSQFHKKSSASYKFCTITPWPLSNSELYRPTDRHTSAKLVPALADRGRRVINDTDTHGQNHGFLDRKGYLFFQYLLNCTHKAELTPLVVCILLRVLGQVQGFRLTQHWFEYFIQ
jgi:hypothetical protein